VRIDTPGISVAMPASASGERRSPSRPGQQERTYVGDFVGNHRSYAARRRPLPARPCLVFRSSPDRLTPPSTAADSARSGPHGCATLQESTDARLPSRIPAGRAVLSPREPARPSAHFVLVSEVLRLRLAPRPSTSSSRCTPRTRTS
jgi:hypothetical protein